VATSFLLAWFSSYHPMPFYAILCCFNNSFTLADHLPHFSAQCIQCIMFSCFLQVSLQQWANLALNLRTSSVTGRPEGIMRRATSNSLLQEAQCSVQSMCSFSACTSHNMHEANALEHKHISSSWCLMSLRYSCIGLF